MHWFFLALSAAVVTATQDAWVKRRFGHLNTYQMSLYPLVYGTPLFLASLPFVSFPSLDVTFWWSFCACLPLEGIAILLYMEAIRVSPLSLTIPYLAFTPVFILLIGFLFLHELPNEMGALGILSTVAGGYILNLNPRNRSLLAPFRAAFQERGSWLMLIVAVLFSVSSILGKQAIMHSSPVFFALFYIPSFTVALFLSLLALGKVSSGFFLHQPLAGLVGGLLVFAQAICHNLAMSMTHAAYMISVKRLAIVFSVLYGGLLFRERAILGKLLGASLMALGTVLISVWGR